MALYCFFLESSHPDGILSGKTCRILLDSVVFGGWGIQNGHVPRVGGCTYGCKYGQGRMCSQCTLVHFEVTPSEEPGDTFIGIDEGDK